MTEPLTQTPCLCLTLLPLVRADMSVLMSLHSVGRTGMHLGSEISQHAPSGDIRCQSHLHIFHEWSFWLFLTPYPLWGFSLWISLYIQRPLLILPQVHEDCVGLVLNWYLSENLEVYPCYWRQFEFRMWGNYIFCFQLRASASFLRWYQGSHSSSHFSDNDHVVWQMIKTEVWVLQEHRRGSPSHIGVSGMLS